MKIILIATLCAIIAACATVKLMSPSTHSSENPAVKETAFERVTRTNTLRCGYATATPWFYADPLTGKKTGYAYDVTMAVAEKIGLKVDWTEETGWGTGEQGLPNRYDMMCGSVCIDPNRNRAAIYSTPFVHIPILPIARLNDNRFSSGINSINNKAIRIGVKNNHVFEYIAKERFPNATLVYANDISDDTEFLLMLETNKIDIAFSGQVSVDLYEKKNPHKIKSLPYPARFCDGGFMMPLGDFNMKQMVDNAILELNTAGKLDEIAKKYMPLDPRYVNMPNKPYR